MVAFIGALIMYKHNSKDLFLKKYSVLLLMEYIIILYCSTILYRTSSEIRRYNFHPFWSYENISNSWREILMNIIVFMPIGFLLGGAIGKYSLKKVILLGFLVSLFIEAMQFALKRGFSEIDDVVHNTFGCLIGFSLWYGIIRFYK